MSRAIVQAGKLIQVDVLDHLVIGQGRPGYSYEGYDYDGMFAWFSFKKPNVRLHVRPPVIQEHKKELAGYAKTKSIVSFPVDKEISIPLVKKLVKASLKVMKDKS